MPWYFFTVNRLFRFKGRKKEVPKNLLDMGGGRFKVW
jgi:hypothetical protein